MEDTVWFVLPKTKELVSPYELQSESQKIEAAQPFTASMVTVVVAEDLDGILRGQNDILVLTKSSLGEQPFVERIHYYEEEVPKGKPIRNMFADNVLVTDDYNGTDRLWLELNVVEVDTDAGERKAAIKAFQALATTAGAVFPVIVPYAFAASAAIGVIEKLASALENDTNVVKVPFALHPGDPRPGKAPLQSGTYVVFPQPQDPSKYKLQSNGLLSTGDEPSDVSYAVFNLSPVKQVSPKFVTSQKVATLLTQMKNGNTNSAVGALEFLNDTLTHYSNFGKLNRYLELKGKDSLTEKEEALLKEIEKIDAVKPFLPRN
ncbi:MAG: hypothetical protein ABID54_03995 [Pseudomonadota bacterium]